MFFGSHHYFEGMSFTCNNFQGAHVSKVKTIFGEDVMIIYHEKDDYDYAHEEGKLSQALKIGPTSSSPIPRLVKP